MATPILLSEIETATPGLKVFPGATLKRYCVTYKGHFYIYSETAHTKHLFRCTENKKGCHGRLHISWNYRSVACEELAGDVSHNHPPSDAVCQRKYALWKMKSAAKSSAAEAAEAGTCPSSQKDIFPYYACFTPCMIFTYFLRIVADRHVTITGICNV
ncbi:uncharacterized protein LOC118437194 [Folsomia candida]|uniref:FLYWCH-type domain-containing protein n=1 Tax=Folsomia candida TaxID=158441 RepID=A0A226DT09_FOLCA|nr:uncharacterized protein LOC118437194 [Folsomia candida]OXA48210.1 hypothetical protein Fcan01_16974 [Folsomia candida]